MFSIVGHPGARLRPTLGLAVGGALLALAACELPKEPRWDVGIVAPFSSDPIGIADFLPGVVQIDSAGDPWVFTIDRQESNVVFSYSDMCALWTCAGGFSAPVPEFSYTDSLVVLFSDASLVSVEGVSGTMSLQVINNLGFEPLRSDATSDGYIALAVRDLGSGTTIDSLFLSAADTAINSAYDVTLNVSAAQLTDGFVIFFHLFSPDDGQPITIDPASAWLSLAASLDGIEVAAATVIVDNMSMDTSFVADIDQNTRDEIMNRVISGAYELKLIHNLELDGTLAVSIAGSEADLFSGDPLAEVRLIDLVFTSDVAQPGELTAQELELIAAFPDIYIGYNGVASGSRPGNQSRFAPDQTLQAQLKVTAQIRIGEQ
ncbi:MAG: hypothetical protein GTO46_13590 [Gemmatimonadetes bacterium]|nr:hypothetical protein [Gemmatimonadota bacterium]NIO32614.1 hypothetical protein [Gemmatimonadota bacterium]